MDISYTTVEPAVYMSFQVLVVVSASIDIEIVDIEIVLDI